jgi:hypothetical protein
VYLVSVSQARSRVTSIGRIRILSAAPATVRGPL